MSNGVKTRFAGLLRELLRRFDENETGADTSSSPRPVTHGAPLPSATHSFPQATASAPRPVAHTAAHQPASAGSANELELPLRSIVDNLPPQLHARLTLTDADLSRATISISIGKITPQLASGVVKITFGELRQAAPTLFNVNEEYDSLPVVLPLNDILSRLNFNALTRNPTQKHIDVPTEITGPFGGRGQGVSISTTPVKPTTPASPAIRVATPATQPVKTPAPPVAPPPPAFVSRTIKPEPVAPPVAPQPPAPPAPSVPQTHLIPMKPVVPTVSVVPPAPVVPPASAPARNGPASVVPPVPLPARNGPPVSPAPSPARNGNGHGVPVQPIIPALPHFPGAPFAPKPAPATPAAAPAAAPESAVILAPLAALSEGWPEALRMEIVQTSLTNAQIALPVNLVEPALKRGRATFTWRHLRSWLRPASSAVSIHDGLELELPLKVIAPLFLASFLARQGQATQIDKSPPAPALPPEIPNLFFGFPQPQALSEVPESPVKAPQPNETSFVPKPADVKQAESNSNYYVWGDTADVPQVDTTEYRRAPTPATPPTDFSSRHTTPKEVVTRALALPGVAGALVALPDGLTVASQIPPDLNADTLAAFLPQIYGRVSQCTKELRMGELNNLNFTVGNVPWKVFRIHGVYFAAFGRAGEQLPTAQLAQLAGELDRKK